ncbi:MAG: isoprenylcysteine carboxylmethyltransferase family protein [Stygiobacter sp.]|nr:MAG: protein-S-isoprenylcysteine methyltransferase [Stygiobacter sp. GWC2_38_9]OGV08141.1 MAG: protein-S-isoprenylcysteine methyltransferase [Stygiobacter sp. RIFOXYB2_FULL_37_11]OGV11861.1 MAG: protein-S-isoprenylcysteine methyltransferase [Stygiobacter sp. RIFOXYA2_FULL_38_8]OGV15657.1 MAG: protein-S-isoprenylcysteine methyltransferase [Stygiobacter sp. RIFOXYC2_FULL_38_25]OGV80771.1 MAG: protein-S-isoprenylcysteine methyltransferase [Stygiobacter sp. GWF2_38_21]OGV87491.1 MAG: protein-S-
MNNFALKVFKNRSYSPIPFLILMLVFQQATPASLIAGFAVALLGEFFRFWGVAYAGSETRRTGEVGATYLVVSGAFAHLRNPLYLGNMLMYLGIGIMSYSLFPYLQIIALAFFMWQYYVIINEEEGFLVQKYGKAYEEYRAAVPKLIPSLKAYPNPGIEQPSFNPKAGLKSEMRTLQAFAFIILIVIVRYALS